MNSIDNQARRVHDEEIDQLASDTTSGATEILRKAGAVFTRLNTASQQDVCSFDQAIETIIETCTALALAQPDMTPLLRLANEALMAARAAHNAQDSFIGAERAALDFIARAERSAHDASLVSATLVRDGDTVLTHSRSSTVIDGFFEVRSTGRNISVVITESRPLFEGRTAAAALAGRDIHVTLIADAAAARVMDEVDLVLVGADKITPAKHVNKIGTRMIALAARERGLPIYAVCDSSKFICGDYHPAVIGRSRSADELWRDAPPGVLVTNSYFEATPLSFFTGIITENGTLSISEAVFRAAGISIDPALVKALGLLRD